MPQYPAQRSSTLYRRPRAAEFDREPRQLALRGSTARNFGGPQPVEHLGLAELLEHKSMQPIPHPGVQGPGEVAMSGR